MQNLMHGLCPELSGAQLLQFQTYYDMLAEWNGRMNLTAITGPEDVANKHFFDSLAAAPYLPQGARCIDVGTGAGFPGVPLLILRDDLTMTLLDGLNKRLVFLEALCEALGLSGRVTLLHARAEDAGQDPAHRAQYDAALTRAVAALPVLLELTAPLLRVGGKSLCYKGEAAEEMEQARNACHLLHCRLSAVPLQRAYGARSLVIAEKIAPTPKTYPRRAGLPAKKPL